MRRRSLERLTPSVSPIPRSSPVGKQAQQRAASPVPTFGQTTNSTTAKPLARRSKGLTRGSAFNTSSSSSSFSSPAIANSSSPAKSLSPIMTVSKLPVATSDMSVEPLPAPEKAKPHAKLPALDTSVVEVEPPESRASFRHHRRRRRSSLTKSRGSPTLPSMTPPKGLNLLSLSMDIDDDGGGGGGNMLMNIGKDFDLSSSLPTNLARSPASLLNRRRTVSAMLDVDSQAVFVPPTPTSRRQKSSVSDTSFSFGSDAKHLHNIVEEGGGGSRRPSHNAAKPVYDLDEDWKPDEVRLEETPKDDEVPPAATLMQAIQRFVCQEHCPLFPRPVFFNQMDVARLIMAGGGACMVHRWLCHFDSVGLTFDTFDLLVRETKNLQTEFLHLQKSVFAHLTSTDSNLLPASVAAGLTWADAVAFVERAGAGSQTIVYLWILDARHESFEDMAALGRAMEELHVSWSQRHMSHHETVCSFMKSSQCELFPTEVRKTLEFDHELLDEIITKAGNASKAVDELKRMCAEDKNKNMRAFKSFKEVAHEVIRIQREREEERQRQAKEWEEAQNVRRVTTGRAKTGKLAMLKVQIPAQSGSVQKVTLKLPKNSARRRTVV